MSWWHVPHGECAAGAQLLFAMWEPRPVLATVTFPVDDSTADFYVNSTAY